MEVIVKVVIEKVDDRNAERIMRTEILDRFVIKSPPTDVPVIFISANDVISLQHGP